MWKEKVVTDTWIWVSGAIVVGLLSGVVGAALIRRIILHDREDRPEIVDAARAAGIFVFLFFLSIGLVVAVGQSDPDNLDPIPHDLLNYSPRVLAAGLILIAGRAIGYAVSGVVANAPGDITPRSRTQAAAALRLAVWVTALVLALSQLGVDTTILQIALAAVLFGTAAAFALLVGLGGRQVSGNLAAGRYLQRLVRVGDRIEVGETAGVVLAVHPATLEVEMVDGRSVHLPHSAVLDAAPIVERPRIPTPGSDW